jgi:flagellar P-ring protein precursor FlgI
VTKQLLANLLATRSINVDARSIQAKNVAAVTVTATLPPFAREGTKIDVVVSSMFDASSLVGGELLQTPLEAVDGEIYAAAQGQVLVGGFQVGGQAASVQKNHPTVGRVAAGALIERELETTPLSDTGQVVLSLRSPSFATSQRLADAINERFAGAATALDNRSVRLKLSKEHAERKDFVGYLSAVNALLVEPDAPARVVINERTGTIVAGEFVRIGRVAISRGNLTFTITESPQVSQPQPFSDNGRTEVVPRTEVSAQESGTGLVVLEEGVSVAKVAEALNALGLSPRDLIDIFQSLAVAGALHAEIVTL